MALNALFDPKKKALVRDALKKGDLSPVFKGKPLAEPARGPDVTVPNQEYLDTMRKIVLMGGLIPRFLPDQPPALFQANCELYAAIREGDARKAMNAVSSGADIHSEAGFVPPTPLTMTFISEPMTPLQYAEKIGQSEIAQFLRRYGAKA